VYGGFLDKFPLGAAFGKGLTLKMGQTHMHKYMPKLLSAIEEGKIDPTFVISHRLKLSEAPIAYDKFNEEKNAWRKVVLKP
jgi:threonine dehydrogenase-like Zn-dependent dehydrogenase